MSDSVQNILPKDTYEYLANFADDRTVLEMVRANKSFDSPDFFRRIMERRYPLLLSDKRQDESWKQLYLRTIKYIGLLQEDFQFPYIPVPGFIPEKVYTDIKKAPSYRFVTYGMDYALQAEDMNLIRYMLDNITYKGAALLGAIRRIAKTNNSALMEQLISYNYHFVADAIEIVIYANNRTMLEYILSIPNIDIKMKRETFLNLIDRVRARGTVSDDILQMLIAFSAQR